MRKRGNSTTLFLVLIILVLLGILGYEHFHNASDTFSAPSPSTVIPAVSTQTSALSTPNPLPGWQTFSDPDFSITYPSYISFAENTAGSELDKNPTALFYHVIRFTPDPNADFSTFSASIEADADQNFVYDLPDRFISYDPVSKTWYVNTNFADKPNSSHADYRNIYDSNNAFTPTLYAKTSGGLLIYGPFSIGDSDRGSSDYLVAVPSDHAVVDFKVTYNNDALSGSSQAVQKLKAQFDRDLPAMLKSIAP